MKLPAVFETDSEGGCAGWVEAMPAAILQGKTVEEAKANLLDASRQVEQCPPELAGKDPSPNAIRESLPLAET